MPLNSMPSSYSLETEVSNGLLSLEQHFLQQQVKIESWFRDQWQKTKPLFYGSVDLRNSGYKLAPVDTNLFPAGFNNLNPTFMPLYVAAVQSIIAEICPRVTHLLLIPENHQRNMYYFENLATLKEILSQAGFSVRVGVLDPELKVAETLTLPSGRTIVREPIVREGNQVGVNGFFPCCIILNNDLSNGVPDIIKNLTQTILPPIQLGWHRRLKSEHFYFYEQVCAEFGEYLSFDPWLISPLFDQCSDIDFMKKGGEERLVQQAEILLQRIRQKYTEYHIQQEPFLVIKADRGTYGMAVMMIRDPQDLVTMNRKERTKMAMIKGGVSVTHAIIQEGVYTQETVGPEKAVAEPVVYVIGRCVVGGFYRVHKNKGIDENLNAPGMNFQPLPFERPCNLPGSVTETPSNRFYLYGVISRLAMVAAAREMTSSAIELV